MSTKAAINLGICWIVLHFVRTLLLLVIGIKKHLI